MAMQLGEGYIDLTVVTQGFNSAMLGVEAKLEHVRNKLLSVSKAAKRMLMVTGAVVGASVKSFASFQEQMAFISTMLDDQSMKLMPAYTKAIKEMAIESGQSTKTISKGLYDILSASIAPAKAIDVLRIAIKAAEGGMTDVATSADVLTTILNSYGWSAEKAGAVSDVLFQIVKRGKITYGQLAPAIGQVAAVASSAGLSFQELAAGFALMTRSGLRARITTTALRSIIMGFMKPVGDAARIFKEKFGVALNTTTLRAWGLTKVIQKLATVSNETVAQIFPNTRAIIGLSAAIQKASELQGDLNATMNASGAAQEAYAKMSVTLSHLMKEVWQSIKVTAIEIGSAFEPAVRKAASAIMKVLKPIREFVAANKELVSRITLASGALLTFAILSPMLISTLLYLTKAFRLIGVAVLWLGGLLLSPWGPIIAAIALVSASIYALRASWRQNFMGMRDMFVEWGNSIKAGWQWLVNNAFKPAYEWIVDKWHKIWPEVKSDFRNFVNDIASTWAGLKAIWKDPDLDILSLKSIKETFSKAFVEMWDEDPVNVLKEKIKTGAEIVGKGLQDASQMIAKFGSNAWDKIGNFFSDYWEVIKKQFNEDFDSFISWVKSKLPEFSNEIEKMQSNLKDRLEGLSMPKTDVKGAVKSTTEIKVGFADIKDAWKQMAVSMNKKIETDIQKNILSENKEQTKVAKTSVETEKEGFSEVTTTLKDMKAAVVSAGTLGT